MNQWINEIFQNSKRVAVPVMTHPGIELTGHRVIEAVTDGRVHYEAIKYLADHYPSFATSTIMDLTVEAEAFGCQINKYSLVTIMKWMFTYAFICTLPFSASDLMKVNWAGLQWTEIGGLAFIVIGATFISYMLVVVGQKNLRPTVAGMYNYIQPLVACIVAICWGMDSFNLVKGIAVVLIFGGVYLVTASRSRKEMEAYEAERQASGK